MTIYDCFLYNGETDQVAMRMEELAPLDVKHVAVQGTRTFQGAPRELVRPPEGVSNFVIYQEDGDVDPWAREEHQRSSMTSALPFARGSDYVIISDADEIPRMTSVLSVLNSALQPGEVVGMRHEMYYFAIDLACPWRHDFAPVIGWASTIRELGAHKARWNPSRWVDGGWHFSYLGGVDAVLAKLASYSHTEFRDVSREQVEACIKYGIDYDNRGRLEHVAIDDTYPECISANPDRWKHLMWENVR